MFIKSRVDSGELVLNVYQKPSGFSQTFYQKPSGFSQMSYQAEWILANLVLSRVDSRRSCTKPSGFWRNLLRNRVGFRQTFINQTDSLQVFSLIKSSHVPSVFSYVGRYLIEVIDGISFRMLVVTPLR